jgi:hypothetical protein
MECLRSEARAQKGAVAPSMGGWMNSYQTNTTPDYLKYAIAHFTFMYSYRIPDDGRMNDRNI